MLVLPRSGFVQLVNQADNAAFGDSGLSYRFCAALRLIKSLGLNVAIPQAPEKLKLPSFVATLGLLLRFLTV